MNRSALHPSATIGCFDCSDAPPRAQFVRQFLAKGNNVVATARNPAAPGLQGLRKEHPELRIDRLDVTDPASIKARCTWH